MKGEFKNGRSYVYVSSNSNKHHNDYLDFTYQEVNNNNWDFICTKEEFNQCVKEMNIINQERKPAKKKSSDNAIACGDVRNKRDDMLLEKLCMADSASDLMEFGKTL